MEYQLVSGQIYVCVEPRQTHARLANPFYYLVGSYTTGLLMVDGFKELLNYQNAEFGTITSNIRIYLGMYDGMMMRPIEQEKLPADPSVVTHEIIKMCLGLTNTK